MKLKINNKEKKQGIFSFIYNHKPFSLFSTLDTQVIHPEFLFFVASPGDLNSTQRVAGNLSGDFKLASFNFLLMEIYYFLVFLSLAEKSVCSFDVPLGQFQFKIVGYEVIHTCDHVFFFHTFLKILNWQVNSSRSVLQLIYLINRCFKFWFEFLHFFPCLSTFTPCFVTDMRIKLSVESNLFIFCLQDTFNHFILSSLVCISLYCSPLSCSICLFAFCLMAIVPLFR